MNLEIVFIELCFELVCGLSTIVGVAALLVVLGRPFDDVARFDLALRTRLPPIALSRGR
jgi:hypothetical protein